MKSSSNTHTGGKARAKVAPSASHPGEVRIIGGLWKRSKLKVDGKAALRPTPDRVRETLFNWLGQNLDSKRCLDVFSGSGALAFEAASRGAAKVIAVETSKAAMQAMNKNANVLDMPNLKLINADAFGFLASTPEKFDVIFIDPPFAQDWWARLAPLIARVAVPEALVYCEYVKELKDKDLPGFTRTRQGRAGVVNYHLFTPITVD